MLMKSCRLKWKIFGLVEPEVKTNVSYFRFSTLVNWSQQNPDGILIEYEGEYSCGKGIYFNSDVGVSNT